VNTKNLAVVALALQRAQKIHSGSSTSLPLSQSKFKLIAPLSLLLASSTTKDNRKMTTCPVSSRRKRVRFEEDTETRQVKRRVMEISLPKSSLLTTEEKTYYWMQLEDHRETLQDVMALMHDCHHEQSSTAANGTDPNQVSFAQYAEALALTFTLCDTPPIIADDHEDAKETDGPSWNIRDSRSVGQLALWASYHTPTRGVESKILPGLNQERQLRRSRTIQGVLEAQKQLKSKQAAFEETMATLGAVSRACSHSAKQFATALAVVDGKQALLEYQCLQQQQQKTSIEGFNATSSEAMMDNKAIGLCHPVSTTLLSRA
jgi:hypothetical protein